MIEQIRKELNQLAGQLGHDHPVVLAKSCELDELLNQYLKSRLPKSNRL